MTWLTIAALGVGPSLVFLHAVYVLDHYEKEPIRNLLRYVVGGAVMCIPAFFLETWVQRRLGTEGAGALEGDLLTFAVAVFVGIALVEECVKLWILRRFARRDHEIDEPFDWIVYSVSVSLGFATLENVLYVASFGAATGVVRAFTAVPTHALLGTLMGDRLARAALAEGISGTGSGARQRVLAILEPTLWHGLYDLCALGAARAAAAGEEGTALLLTGGLFAVLGALWAAGIRRVVRQGRISRDLHARGLAHRGGSRVPPILWGTTLRAD